MSEAGCAAAEAAGVEGIVGSAAGGEVAGAGGVSGVEVGGVTLAEVVDD